jgi:hypothetical protein
MLCICSANIAEVKNKICIKQKNGGAAQSGGMIVLLKNYFKAAPKPIHFFIEGNRKFH